MTLIIVPKMKIKDSTKTFKPIVISGSVEEVENAWIDAVSIPLEKLKGLQIDSKAFEESIDKKIEEVKSDAKKATTKANAIKKQAETKSVEKTPAQLLKDVLKKADATFEEKKYSEAKLLYEEALLLAPADKKILASIQKCKSWINAIGGLLDESNESKPNAEIFENVVVKDETPVQIESESLIPDEEIVSGESEDKNITNDEDFSL